MTWSVHVPAGPCESFSERAAVAITTVSDTYRAQSQAAAQIAADIVANHMPGQQDTAYAANLSGHDSHGSAGLTVSVSAAPVPKP